MPLPMAMCAPGARPMPVQQGAPARPGFPPGRPPGWPMPQRPPQQALPGTQPQQQYRPPAYFVPGMPLFPQQAQQQQVAPGSVAMGVPAAGAAMPMQPRYGQPFPRPAPLAQGLLPATAPGATLPARPMMPGAPGGMPAYPQLPPGPGGLPTVPGLPPSVVQQFAGP